MKLLKDSDRAVKARIEQERRQFLAENPGSDKLGERQEYLQRTYVPALLTIGSTFADLQKLLPNFMRLIQVRDGHFEIHSVADVKALLCEVFVGDQAFEPRSPEEGELRPVYVKRFSTDGKEYVKDSKGSYTRRYAWCEKSFHQFVFLLELREIHGRFAYQSKEGFRTDPFMQPPGDPNSRQPRPDPRSIDPESSKVGEDLRRRYGGTSSLAPLTVPGRSAPSKYKISADALTRDQVAFLQVEDGTTLGQRANSLGSSGRILHSNHGTLFSQTDGVLLEIDLARIDERGDQFLLNLYSMDSAGAFEGALEDNPAGDRGGTRTAPEAKEHFLYSTRKNREVLLQKIPWAAIDGVLFYSAPLFANWQARVRAALGPRIPLIHAVFRADRDFNPFAELRRRPPSAPAAISAAAAAPPAASGLTH